MVPDPARRSLATAASTTLGFMTEFFTTTSSPAGHGFTQASLDQDFACYSFVPKAGIPVKVLVLDDTVKGPGQPNYSLGGLDQARLDWLTAELQAGQDSNQLMINHSEKYCIASEWPDMWSIGIHTLLFIP